MVEVERGEGTFCILGSGDQVGFCEGGDASVGVAAAAEAGELEYQGGGHDFVVSAAVFYLGCTRCC